MQNYNYRLLLQNEPDNVDEAIKYHENRAEELHQIRALGFESINLFKQYKLYKTEVDRIESFVNCSKQQNQGQQSQQNQGQQSQQNQSQQNQQSQHQNQHQQSQHHQNQHQNQHQQYPQVQQQHQNNRQPLFTKQTDPFDEQYNQPENNSYEDKKRNNERCIKYCDDNFLKKNFEYGKRCIEYAIETDLPIPGKVLDNTLVLKGFIIMVHQHYNDALLKNYSHVYDGNHLNVTLVDISDIDWLNDISIDSTVPLFIKKFD